VRILVLGGTRFIGPHLVRQLVERGHAVSVFHRGTVEADLPAGVRHLHGDQARLHEFRPELEAIAPDVVVAMWAMAERDARAIVEATVGLAPRLVLVSSGDVYRAFARNWAAEPGPPEPVPLTEESSLREKLYAARGATPRADDDPQRWLDDYEKILVERVVLAEHRLRPTVLRLPGVHGPGDYQHRQFGYLKRMQDGRPAILLDQATARWRFARGYAENVAAAIALAATDDRAAGRVYNVAEPEAFTELEWVERVADAAGWRGRIVVTPADRAPIQDLNYDSSRIRQELGYREHVRPDEGLRRTVAWEIAHPPVTVDPRQFDYAAEDALLADLAAGR
jgi:nucleoside-diphosphate-sugar epimerase